MPASVIIVQYRDGSPGIQRRVVLGFSSGLTSPAYTDRHGEVCIEHSSVGRADVYVNGDKVGSFQAPGKTAVVLR